MATTKKAAAKPRRRATTAPESRKATAAPATVKDPLIKKGVRKKISTTATPASQVGDRVQVIVEPEWCPSPWCPSPRDITVYDNMLLDQIAKQMVRANDTQYTDSRAPLFRVNIDGTKLWSMFLTGLPKTKENVNLRQIYTCNACRKFVERYGNLVIINRDGTLTSAIWPNADKSLLGPFAGICRKLKTLVESATVDGVFYSRDFALGQARTGEWLHFAVVNPAPWKDRVKTAEQGMAEKLHEYELLVDALKAYTTSDAVTALAIASSDMLYRSEKVKGVAEWFHRVSTLVRNTGGQRRTNLLWREAALAPPGFCHVKSSMIGTLLEDIKNGYPLDAVKRRFAEKMHPLQYQRPTAAPSTTQVEQAEKIVARLGLESALRRRYASLSDVLPWALWYEGNRNRPYVEAKRKATSGVFSGVPTRESQPGCREIFLGGPGPTHSVGRITWAKFSREVLPLASRLELYLPPTSNLPLTTITTAVDPTAPPILQWDDDADYRLRNRFSWYCYNGGVSARDFNRSPASWAEVTAIVPLPSQFGRMNWLGANPLGPINEHWGVGVLLLIKDAFDRRGGGRGFFPEQLRSELNPYRKTIEAFADRQKLEGSRYGVGLRSSSLHATQHACGWDFRKGHEREVRVRAWMPGLAAWAEYVLDRWE